MTGKDFTLDDRRSGAALLRAMLVRDSAAYVDLRDTLSDQELLRALTCAVGCAGHLLRTTGGALERLDDILAGAAVGEEGS